MCYLNWLVGIAANWLAGWLAGWLGILPSGGWELSYIYFLELRILDLSFWVGLLIIGAWGSVVVKALRY